MFSKVKNVKQIQFLVKRFKKIGQKIVFTNGCFDILHAGHVSYLVQAKKLGDYLIVGLNSDRSVRKIKGPKRPINPEKARAIVLSALSVVDYVVIFNEETPIRLIQKIEPHILVKGSDWKGKRVAGEREMLTWGGQVRFAPLVKGFSTTRTLQKIQDQ